MNVDEGADYTVDRKCLLKPTNLIRSLPVRCVLVKLMYLESIPTPVANNKCLGALESCMENGAEFKVYTEGVNNGVDLLFRNNEHQSLCKKLLPMVFEPREISSRQTASESPKVNLIEKPQLPMTPPNTPLTVDTPVVIATVSPPQTENMAPKTYTLDDLEIVPIECGDECELFVLDATTLLTLESPYITAADFKNKAFLRKMEGYLAMVNEYCNSPNAPKSGYAPKYV